jgi:AcrR family transcriptional regulator
MSSPPSSTAKATPYHHGQLRQALLDSARALVAEGGLEALTLRAVARRIGVSTAAPYHHFQNRAEVIQALVLENFLHLDAASRQALEGLEEPLVKLQALGRTYVGYAVEHPADFRLMFRPELAPPLALGSLQTAPVIGVLLTVLREAGLTGTTLEVTGLAVWSLVHGMATLMVDGPLQDHPARGLQLVDAITNLVRFTPLEPYTRG